MASINNGIVYGPTGAGTAPAPTVGTGTSGVSSINNGIPGVPSYGITPAPTTGTTAYGSGGGVVNLNGNSALNSSIQNSSYIDALYPGAYGSVPGATQLYPNIYQQVAGQVPGLPNMTAGAAGNIQSEINGTIPQSVVNQISQASAEQGVASGSPGSGLNTNNLIQSLGLNAEALTQKGTQDYLSFLTGVGSTQTNPGQAEALSQSNAQLAAAPNPQQAANALSATYATSQAAAQGRIGSGSGSSAPSIGPGGKAWQPASSESGAGLYAAAQPAGFSSDLNSYNGGGVGYYPQYDASGNIIDPNATISSGTSDYYTGGLTDTTGTSGSDSGGN